jgi:hypothetical protein
MRGAGPAPAGAEPGLPAAAGTTAAAAVALALGGALLLAAGCERGDDRAAIQERLRAKGAAEVVREAAAARFTPPADGRLSDAQVRMYLAVRERESRIREAAALETQRRRGELAAGAERAERSGKQERTEGPAGRDRADRREQRDLRPRGAAAVRAAPDDAALGAAADLRAAQELRANPKEYAWVRARVAEAETAAATRALYQKMATGREQLLARMRRDRDALTDPAARAAAEREIEDWRRGLQAAEPMMTPAVRANVALLARYREPLARLRASEERALAAAAGLEPPAGSGGPAAVR